jgi:CheY-like chemotaxis protein
LVFPRMPRAKIIVVEDNKSEVFLIRRALLMQTEDLDLEVAEDGERALQFVQGQREHLPGSEHCVILLDLHLPKHDGIEVLRAIRKEPLLSHIYVVVTTNGASPEEEEQLRSLGADFRLKPRDLLQFSELAADLIAIGEGLRSGV